jgi:hypothetical protein
VLVLKRYLKIENIEKKTNKFLLIGFSGPNCELIGKYYLNYYLLFNRRFNM